MVLYHIVEGVAVCKGLYLLVVNHDRGDGKTIIRNDGYGQALAVLHVGGAGRSDAAALACRRSDSEAVMGEGSRDGMVGPDIGERPAILSRLLVAVNGQIVDVPALIGGDGAAPAVAAKHLAGASGADAAALAGRCHDGVAVAHKGRRQAMVGGDAAEGVFRDGTAIHAVHEHRVGVVAVGGRDGHRQVLTIGHAGGAGRSDAATLADRRGDGVAIMGEGSRDGMVGLDVGERPAALCGLLFAVNGQIVDIPALIGGDGAAPAVAAKHLAGASGADAAALAGRCHDGVAVAHKGRRQAMVGGDAAEGVFRDGTAIHAVHEHRVGVVAVGGRDGHRQVLTIGHAGGAGRSDAATLAGRRGDGVAVLGEGSRDGMVGMDAGERPAGLCGLLFAVNGQIVDIPAFIGHDGAAPAVTAKHLAGASRADAAALASHGHNAILLLQERGINHIIQ